MKHNEVNNKNINFIGRSNYNQSESLQLINPFKPKAGSELERCSQLWKLVQERNTFLV